MDGIRETFDNLSWPWNISRVSNLRHHETGDKSIQEYDVIFCRCLLDPSSPYFFAHADAGSEVDAGVAPRGKLQFYLSFGFREIERRSSMTSTVWLVYWCRKIQVQTMLKIWLGPGERGHGCTLARA